MNCNNCGEEFDMRYLNQVLMHEICKAKIKATETKVNKKK